MTAYYNENDPYMCAWLEQLIKDGLIPHGDVDNRSINDVEANDLTGYTQCHFFAGCGGWPVALRMAGWPDDKPVWTGSPPCQPFSLAGKRGGTDDDRDLWPTWLRLIAEQKPDIVFGEQVVDLGWLDRTANDLEGEGYACGTIIAPALAVGAPHRRDRLFFVADSNDSRRRAYGGSSITGKEKLPRASVHQPLPHTDCERFTAHEEKPFASGQRVPIGAEQAHSRPVAHTLGSQCKTYEAITSRRDQAYASSERGSAPRFWDDARPYLCGEGKQRPLKPGLRCMVDGLPRDSRLVGGYGNAIVPQVAAEAVIIPMMELMER